MDQVMQQLGSQLFWVLVIVVAGFMGAGMYRLNHRGSQSRTKALVGKKAPAKKPGSAQKKSTKKKKRK